MYAGSPLRRDGGGSIGGIVPSAVSADPMSQNMISQFSSMPAEQLQETIARVGAGSPAGQMAQKILQQKMIMGAQSGSGSLTGANAAAMQTGMTNAAHMADGGTPYNGGPPSGYWVSQMNSPGKAANYGLLNSPFGAAGGRTDTLPHVVAADSYVLPADVVSGLGEGDTFSGAKLLDAIFHSMPMGISRPPAANNSHRPPPPPPSNWRPPQPQAKGGASGNGAQEPVPVIVANGEYVVHPSIVRALGEGDSKRGHKVLDAFVKHVRAKTAKTLTKLPGPVQ